MLNTAKNLADALPDNIRFLSTLIARKPTSVTTKWAATPDEAFSLYTPTSTVNYFLSFSNVLAELNWPFPAYADLRAALQLQISNERRRVLSERGRGPLRWVKRRLQRSRDEKLFALASTDFMSGWFQSHSRGIFSYWNAAPVFSSKLPIIKDIEETYRHGFWAACIPTALPLLDFLIRAYFETDQFSVSIQTLRNAFEMASILPKDLMPGYAVWEGQRNPEGGNAVARSVEDDLRLPGVLLSSFVEFANAYYGWYKTDTNEPKVLNRHAILHCATDYWTREYTSKLLTFLDLALRLQRPLEVIIHGADAPWLKAARDQLVR